MRARVALLIGGALVLPAPLCAQDADADAAPAGEPVIVVTAPGGAIDGDEAAGVDRAEIAGGTRANLAAALERGVPGATLGEAQGNPWQAAISWRGYGVSALQGTEQGMAVYLDGIRFNQPFGDTLSLDVLPEAALARAELREASPVYGRNALGGALLLATRAPGSLRGVEATAALDSIGGVSGSLAAGTGRTLVVAEALHDPGWRDTSPSTLYRLFAASALERDGWGVTAQAIAADTELYGNAVAPVELLDADHAAVFTKPDIARARYLRVAMLPHLELSQGSRIEGNAFFQRYRRKTVSGDLADFGPCDSDPGLLCLGDEEDGFMEPLRGPDGVAVAVDPDIDDYAVQNRGDESTRGGGLGLQWLKETDTTIGKRRFALGASWERFTTDFAVASELGALEPDRSVTTVGPALTSDDGGITPVLVTARLADLAVFASAEIPLLRGVSAEIGLRWSENRVRLIDRIGTALNGRHRFHRLSPSAELDWAFAQDWSLSLGAAETSRNPTPAELSCADPESPCALANFFIADPPLKPVVARNYHAELRREGEGLTGHVALWRSDSRDDIRHIASEVRGRAYFTNLGSSRKRGVELATEWRSGPWRVGADYGFTDARFRSGFTISSPANPAADENGLVEVSKGDRIPALPRHAANLRLAREGARWGMEATLRYRSGQVLVGDEGNDTPPTPGYAIIDLRGHLALAPGVTLVAEARNLFDHRYATFGTFSEVEDIFLAEAPDADNPRAYAPGMPRRVSVAIKAAF